MRKPLLEVRDLNIAFETNRGDVRPVRDVAMTITPEPGHAGVYHGSTRAYGQGTAWRGRHGCRCPG